MFKVARGGANWLITPLALAIVLVGLSGPLDAPVLQSLSTVPFFLFLAFWFFFRDPDRRTAEGVACPADGRVVRLDAVEDPDLGDVDRLSIFMRGTDVHVNRFPLSGSVRSVEHRPGRHVPAFSKDSDRNERVTTRIRTDLGDVKVVQIAGAVARRIVPYSRAGDHVHRGEKLGLIRLGSRCDLLVPRDSVAWTVEVGDRVYAGATQVGVVAAGTSLAAARVPPSGEEGP